jgi:arginine N-succinyltransferase
MLGYGRDLLAHHFRIRDARMSDIDAIFELSELLNTVNLPLDKEELEAVIAQSENSFAFSKSESPENAFLFVLVDPEDRVIGTSQIFAKHGLPSSPHLYFQVDEEERCSETIKRHFRHRILRFGQNFDGPTEVGSLVLARNYRCHAAKLGRNLSYVRFLFMAFNPQCFGKKVLAELLPPLGPNMESALWEAIGRQFTGLDYYTADRISRKNKEFIKSLFPTEGIYVCLLPKAAQEVIGQVGLNSKAAAHLLSKIGFTYSQRVDPFDGGPHFEANFADISLIKNAMHATAHAQQNHIPRHGNDAMREALVCRFNPERASGERFCATVAAYFFNRESSVLEMHQRSLDMLKITNKQRVIALDITAEA